MNTRTHALSRRRFLAAVPLAATLPLAYAVKLRAAEGAGPAQPGATDFQIQQDAAGQYEVREGHRPVLRYNYRTIEPGERLNGIAPGNRIYARARSDYLHPLYGPEGEELTYDWSKDHPHHRGIYWAWPEVDWRGQRGDLHALQKVFARPTGRCRPSTGPDFAQVEAENTWKWNDQEEIVRETAILRAYRANAQGRLVDLTFQFTALGDPVLLARRGTSQYGGLNLRLASVRNQAIQFHTDPPDSKPRRAWAELSGTFAGAKGPAGLVVLPHPTNPCHPGDWVKYPELNWFQPTFPASGTRYELRKDQPLVLRFRLWIHPGPAATQEQCAAQWRAWESCTA